MEIIICVALGIVLAPVVAALLGLIVLLVVAAVALPILLVIGLPCLLLKKPLAWLTKDRRPKALESKVKTLPGQVTSRWERS